MKIGYCVAVQPHLASYRLRVAIPAPLTGLDYEIGTYGNPSFFYKHTQGDRELAQYCGPFVYDVVNDHFGTDKIGDHYFWMCDNAKVVTTSSKAMADIVNEKTGRTATVIDDPYENEEKPPECKGQEVLWFGHSANIRSLMVHIEEIEHLPITLCMCTNYQHTQTLPWSMDAERRSLERAAVVLLTGANKGASANRVVKAIRAGRFVVAPEDCPESWREFDPFTWIGPVRKGIEWALAHRDAACRKVCYAQDYVRERFSPETVAKQWAGVFKEAA